MSMTFKEWLADADMPERMPDGRWVDNETGIIFPGEFPERDENLVKAAESRKPAKALGGKALKGSAKQKKWAEELRKKALAQMSSELSARVLGEPVMQYAAWWIDNRAKLCASSFPQHFRNIEIRAFQKPLIDLIDILKRDMAVRRTRSGGMPIISSKALLEAEALVAKMTTDRDEYAAMADRVIEGINALN